MSAETNEHSERIELTISKLRDVAKEVVTESRQLDELYDALTADHELSKRRSSAASRRLRHVERLRRAG